MVDITSCDVDKILRAFEEIFNYIGSNIHDIGHQIQQTFTSGVHYDWTATRPPDQRKLKVEPENDRSATP